MGEASCLKLDPTRGTPLVMAVGAVAVARAAATGVGAPSAPAGKHLRSATRKTRLFFTPGEDQTDTQPPRIPPPWGGDSQR